jgi:hypothetical protein
MVTSSGNSKLSLCPDLRPLSSTESLVICLPQDVQNICFMSGAIGFIFAVRRFIIFWLEGLNDARFVIDSVVNISKVRNEM